jgi:hypothetical protein
MGQISQFAPSFPGAYERPGETIECTALGYALRLEAQVKGVR